MKSWLAVAATQAQAAGFFITLLLAVGAVYFALTQLNRDKADRPLLFAVAMVAGPLLVAFEAYLLLRFAPGTLPYRAYLALPILGVAITAMLVALIARNMHSSAALSEVAQPRKSGRSLILSVIAVVSAAVLAYGLISAAILTLMTPTFGNDSLEYAAAGRFIAQTRSMANYPFLDGELTHGLVTPWTHPPGHITLIALSFVFMGGDLAQPEAAKFLGFYFAVSLALLLFTLASRNGSRAAGFIAAAIPLAAPVYFNSIIQNGVDPMRLAAFTAAGASAWMLLRRPNAGNAIICGLACGCASFTHSIGLLTLGLILPAYFILDRGALGARVGNAAIVAVIGAAFVLPTVLTNIAVFNNPIQDQSPAWSIPQLQYDTHLAIERALESPTQVVTFGLLRGFTERETFGYAFWVATIAGLVAVIAYARQRKLLTWIFPPRGAEPDPSVLALLILGAFLTVMTLSVAAGSLVAVKNARYLATVLPLAALAAGRLLTAPLARRASS